MNILQINTIDNKGGAARVAYGLKRELERLGHETSMFVKLKYSGDENVHVAKWPNPINKFLTDLSGKDIGSYLSNKIRPLMANDIEFFKTDKILETDEFKKADIVHCHNLHGNYFSLSTLVKIAKIKPVVWTLHDMWAITPDCYHTRSEVVSNGLFQCSGLEDLYRTTRWDNSNYLSKKKAKIYSECKVNIVTPCEWLAEKVKRSLLGEQNNLMIYNGIDNKAFLRRDKKRSREDLGLPSDKKIVLFVSAMGAEVHKGQQYIDETVSKNKNNDRIMFVCVGGRSGAAGINSGNIFFVPYISDQDLLSKYYSAADIFIFTSLAETFPLVILEAMSSGLPVVSFDVGGVKEAVRHKINGYVANYRDAEDLNFGINSILDLSTEDYEAMANKCVSGVAQKFTLNRMVDEYVKIYQNLLSDR